MLEWGLLIVWTLFIFGFGVMCGMAYLGFWEKPWGKR